MKFPITAEVFFQKFFSDSPDFSVADHLKKASGATDLDVSKWIDNDEVINK